MLNYIWAFMIIIGIIYGSLTGHMVDITNAALDSAKDAVALCITMAGIMSLWMGLMEIAQDSGLITKITKKIQPFITLMFPRIPKGHKSMEYIATNMVANIFGLGWAATPPGLKAMESLQELNEERCKKTGHSPKMASNEMCTFLIINISSLELIPVNIIAYRSQYGSVNPAAIVGPAILATSISTLVGIIFARVMDRKRYQPNMRK